MESVAEKLKNEPLMSSRNCSRKAGLLSSSLPRLVPNVHCSNFPEVEDRTQKGVVFRVSC